VLINALKKLTPWQLYYHNVVRGYTEISSRLRGPDTEERVCQLNSTAETHRRINKSNDLLIIHHDMQ